jgi:beta-lactamase regulating signal transducer with metallopeptidase domain
MESLLIYLAKATGLITLFFMAYYIFLKKETFFSSIRFFLLAGIVTSLLLPLFTITKTVWITPQPLPEIINSGNVTVQAYTAIESPGFELNWWYIAIGLYITGLVFFLGRFFIDLLKISKLLASKKAVKEGIYRIINSDTVTSPFSFFSYIVYNAAVLQPEELTTIIAHEKVHSRQLHSLDMLLSQLACIFMWFNPFVWLYKKQIAQNLEFIADAEAVRVIADSKTYQKTLLKITLQPECIAITNHFYQSLIKKRIIMLNKQQSKKRNFWKFAVVLPALAAFVYLYQVEVVAQERKIINYNTLQDEKPVETAGSSASTVSSDSIKKIKTSTVIKKQGDEKATETSQEKKKIIVVNGIIQTTNEIHVTGKEVVVTELSGEDAVKKYGDCGKYGAVEYTTTVEFDPKSTDRTTNIIHTTTRTEISTNINTSITDRVKEMNASPNRTVTQIYLRDEEGNLIANDGITKYFVISSYTTDIQLNVYKEDLAEAGITVEYSDLVRNSKGKITGIKVKLNDKKGRTSATWSSDRNKDGIPDIYIGKIKGQLTTSSSKTP